MSTYILCYVLVFFFCYLCRADNNKLKSDLRKRDEEVASLQAALERFNLAVSRNCGLFQSSNLPNGGEHASKASLLPHLNYSEVLFFIYTV